MTENVELFDGGAKDAMTEAELQRALEAMSQSETIKWVGVTRYAITDGVLEQLMALLVKNTSLGKLDVRHCVLGNVGVCILADALECNRGLASLSLVDTACGDDGLYRLGTALQRHSGLAELDLTENTFSSEALYTFLQLIANNKHMNTLRITCAHLDPEHSLRIQEQVGALLKRNRRRKQRCIIS